MEGDAPERTGVLVIRVWVESGAGPIRARITGRVDVLEGLETTVTVAGAQAAIDVVGEWFEAFARRSDSLSAPP